MGVRRGAVLVLVLVALAGCTGSRTVARATRPPATPTAASPAMRSPAMPSSAAATDRAPLFPERPVSTDGDDGLRCVDAEDDVDPEPGWDIELVDVAIEDGALTAVVNAASVAFVAHGDTDFELDIDPTDGSGGLTLEATQTWTGDTVVSQWDPERGERVVPGGSLTAISDLVEIAWPLRQLGRPVPTDFTWRAQVVYDQDDRDSCPGARGDEVSTMHGRWVVAGP